MGQFLVLFFFNKCPSTDGVILAIDYLHNITTKLYTYQCDEDETENVSNEQKTKATVNQEIKLVFTQCYSNCICPPGHSACMSSFVSAKVKPVTKHYTEDSPKGQFDGFYMLHVIACLVSCHTN